MKSLVCVVEGHGEVEAAPILCDRILTELLRSERWRTENRALRFPRSELVGAGSRIGRSLERAVKLAATTHEADAVLVVCDSDDDCPAIWGPAASSVYASKLPLGAVMASREFESWFLHGASPSELAAAKVRVGDFDDEPRDAKKAFAKIHEGYGPVADQANATRSLDLERAWARSSSFDKLVRTLATLTGSSIPSRPNARDTTAAAGRRGRKR